MKHIKLIISIIVAVGLAFWVHSRWQAWFGFVNETDFAVATAPDRITLLPGEDFSTQRIVTWRCGNSIDSASLTLAHGTDTTLWKATGSIIEGHGKTHDTYYSARIINLLPGTTYSYKITTGGKSSEWYSFTTPAAKADSREFVYFGDVQDSINGPSSHWFANIAKLHPNAEFWACGGDLTERPINKYLNYLYTSTNGLLASIPIINAPGNHDYIKGLPNHIDNRWTASFAYPDNGAKKAKGISYYIDFPDMRVIVLDTHGLTTSPILMSEYSWLKETLVNSGNKWKVVIFHYPIYSVRKGRNNFAIRNAFLPLLEKYNAHLVLQGHEHGYYRRTSDSGNNPVYIVSFMSPKAYKARTADTEGKIIPDTPMYQVIDYTSKTMTLRSFSAENNKLCDSVTIDK